MELFLSYLNKHSHCESLISSEPEKDLSYIVVIPAYLEPGLENTLISLFNASPTRLAVEVIAIVNWPERETHENIQQSRNILKSAINWTGKHSSRNKMFHIIESGDQPKKKAGVGFARKTGMDEAIRRLCRSKSPEGVIISLDADTICDKNYLVEIEKFFTQYPEKDGCSIYFEHPLEGTEFPANVYNAALNYELHMRYYLHSLRYTGYPSAFYTVGSAFAVKASAYCRSGGMNSRKAGEDFYFIQKLSELGNFSELNSTRVIPSPRPSFRVPFGTGRSIINQINSQEILRSYNPGIFEILRELFNQLPRLYESLQIKHAISKSDLNPALLEFLNDIDYDASIESIFLNTSDLQSFIKRFYRYFNMFRILKFARYVQKYLPDLPVTDCARQCLYNLSVKGVEKMTRREMLEEFRKRDRNVSALQ